MTRLTAYVSPDFIRGAANGKLSRAAFPGGIQVNLVKCETSKPATYHRKLIRLKKGEALMVGDDYCGIQISSDSPLVGHRVSARVARGGLALRPTTTFST